EADKEEKAPRTGRNRPPAELAHFAMLSRGNCWLNVEGIAEAIPLTGGDFISLARDTSILMRDNTCTSPKETFREVAARAKSNVAHCGGGGAPTTIVSGSLS